jgi:hypothetical protein
MQDDRAWPRVVLVAAVAFVAYANTPGHGFVCDDLPNIVQSRWIRRPRVLAVHRKDGGQREA